MLMIKSNIGIYNYQEDMTLRQMMRSGQVSNSSESPSMFSLSESFRVIDENWTSYDDKVTHRLFQQSKGQF